MEIVLKSDGSNLEEAKATAYAVAADQSGATVRNDSCGGSIHFANLSEFPSSNLHCTCGREDCYLIKYTMAEVE